MSILLNIFQLFLGNFEKKIGQILFPTLLNLTINLFSSLHEKNTVLHHFKFLRKFYPPKKLPNTCSPIKIWVIKKVRTCHLLCKRPGYYHIASKTHATDRIFKLSPIYASVIYQIPWSRWIHWKFYFISEKLNDAFVLLCLDDRVRNDSDQYVQ